MPCSSYAVQEPLGISLECQHHRRQTTGPARHVSKKAVRLFIAACTSARSHKKNLEGKPLTAPATNDEGDIGEDSGKSEAPCCSCSWASLLHRSPAARSFGVMDSRLSLCSSEHVASASEVKRGTEDPNRPMPWELPPLSSPLHFSIRKMSGACDPRHVVQ